MNFLKLFNYLIKMLTALSIQNIVKNSKKPEIKLKENRTIQKCLELDHLMAIKFYYRQFTATTTNLLTKIGKNNKTKTEQSNK